MEASSRSEDEAPNPGSQRCFTWRPGGTGATDTTAGGRDPACMGILVVHYTYIHICVYQVMQDFDHHQHC